MRPEQWERVKTLFQQALDQPADQREAWIARASGDDQALRREVEGLLAAHHTADDFLEQPPATVDAAHIQIFPPGTLLGSYEVIDELGRGGGGIVYLAQDHRLGRRVALKLVAAAANPERHDRLRREARAAATITHPSVATIYALEEFDNQLFIVSEYVRGRTLRAALADGPLPRDRVFAIARDVADALRAAHEAGVVHRDLKPENILLSDTGAVKVVDFGIARVADDGSAPLTRQGALLGTPAYMSPEQLLGHAADARADIYAFGIVLSEMLSGRHPGLAGSALSAPGIDNELSRVARECTQLDPDTRIQTAALLVAALDQIQHGSAATRTNARWWWEFHQVAVATIYGGMLWPSWQARPAIDGSLGRIFFIVILGAVIVSASLRLHLVFTSRFYPAELTWVRRRSGPWVAAADAAFALGLVAGALLIRVAHSSVDVLLLSVGIGAAVAFLVIEPATTRAAFPESV